MEESLNQYQRPDGLTQALCQFIQFKANGPQQEVSKSFLFKMSPTSYSEKIGQENFDPTATYAEVASSSVQLYKGTRCNIGETALEHHILNCLTDMVYGSNMIQNTGSDLIVTKKLCHEIFNGHRITLPTELDGVHYPASRENMEVVQHAKAAVYIINQLCMGGQDLSEDIILQTHRFLTEGMDADDGVATPWEEYSGKYRTHEVHSSFHTFPHSSHVPYLMERMIRDLKSDLKEMRDTGAVDPIALASKYAHIYYNIHPFADGNTRMKLLILNAMLFTYGNFLVCVGQREEDRSIYADVVANGMALEEMYEDAEEEEKPLLYKELASFVLRHVRNSMKDLIGAMSQELVETAKSL